MIKEPAKIIKGDNVDLQGKFQIDINQTSSAKNTTAEKQQPANNTPAKAILVENQPDCAIVEITCSCGKKTYLKCQYENNSNNADKTIGENNNEN